MQAVLEEGSIAVQVDLEEDNKAVQVGPEGDSKVVEEEELESAVLQPLSLEAGDGDEVGDGDDSSIVECGDGDGGHVARRGQNQPGRPPPLLGDAFDGLWPGRRMHAFLCKSGSWEQNNYSYKVKIKQK